MPHFCGKTKCKNNISKILAGRKNFLGCRRRPKLNHTLYPYTIPYFYSQKAVGGVRVLKMGGEVVKFEKYAIL